MQLPLLVLMLASPDGQVAMRIESRPALTWSVTLAGRSVLEPSPLGITVDGVNLGDGAKAGRISRRRRGPCLEASIPFTGEPAFTLEARVCNDGVAFRHLVPGAGRRVPDEATAFRLPPRSVVWSHDLEGHYEALYKQRPAEELQAGEWAAPPVTYRLPGGGYASITEAALYRYAGMALQAEPGGVLAARLGHTHPPSYPFRLRYKDDIERLKTPAAVEGPITTPWRVVLVGKDLDALVNARMIERLSPPPDRSLFPARSSWVKPGRAVWKYLDGGENNEATVREFSRLASQLGFEYQVVEGFWQKWDPALLKDVIAESRKQGVGLILWKHSNQLRTPEARRAFFDLIRDAGAAGAKIDFFDHEAKEVVEFYEVMLREAAQRKLVVNFHGANKPAGEWSTWPNELTREAVRGMESRKSPRARHNATLPFTRMLAGPMDYTPVHFGERRNDTTWAHQLATAVSFTSGLLTYAAHPKALVESPAVELIRSIPAVWEETRVLAGSEIGEVSILARRNGKTWFLAVLNGESPRKLRVPLAFLRSGSWSLLEARDPEKVEKGKATPDTVLDLDLAAGGGYLARFAPIGAGSR